MWPALCMPVFHLAMLGDAVCDQLRRALDAGARGLFFAVGLALLGLIFYCLCMIAGDTRCMEAQRDAWQQCPVDLETAIPCRTRVAAAALAALPWWWPWPPPPGELRLFREPSACCALRVLVKAEAAQPWALVDPREREARARFILGSYGPCMY